MDSQKRVESTDRSVPPRYRYWPRGANRAAREKQPKTTLVPRRACMICGTEISHNIIHFEVSFSFSIVRFDQGV